MRRVRVGEASHPGPAILLDSSARSRSRTPSMLSNSMCRGRILPMKSPWCVTTGLAHFESDDKVVAPISRIVEAPVEERPTRLAPTQKTPAARFSHRRYWLGACRRIDKRRHCGTLSRFQPQTNDVFDQKIHSKDKVCGVVTANFAPTTTTTCSKKTTFMEMGCNTHKNRKHKQDTQCDMRA